MNIKDYKKAFDGIRATEAFKKRVMDSVREADEAKKRSVAKHRLRLAPILLGAAGAAAAFALIIAGGGFLRSLFAEERSIVVTASEYPDLGGGSPALAPGKNTVGELATPKLDHSPDVYERMPALKDNETRSAPFSARFTTFGDALIEAVGTDAFAAWRDHFVADPPYYTFYNNPNLLSFVTYFEIDEGEARRLLAARGGFNESEIGAIAGRDESLCRRLFVSDELPLLRAGEEGFFFYTMENLYEMSSDELTAIFVELGVPADRPPEALALLREWAETLGDDVYTAAVERKSLLVSAALFEQSRPSLAEGSELYAIYDPAVSDFNETIDLGGVEIYNYVLKLVKDSAPDEKTYETAIGGAAGISNRATIPSYRRLLTIESLNITPDRLAEALNMIDRHYYGQTGAALYSAATLETILYGTDQEFEEIFLSPYTFCSEENALGSVWLSGAEIYEAPVSAWLGYADLSSEYLQRLEDALEGMQKEFFRQKVEYYREIRLLTADKLDGGALAADDALVEMPPLPETLQTALATAQYGVTNVSGTGIYYASLTELAALRLNGYDLLNDVRRMIDENPALQAYEYKAPLLRKAYLYLWHTDGVNLYRDEYLESLELFADSDYTALTDGETLYIGYHNADLTHTEDSPIAEYAAAHHLTRIAPYSEYGATEETKTTFVRDFMGENALYLAVTPNPLLPEAGARGVWICAGYNYDPWLEYDHAGLDFAAAEGDAVADGVVISTANEPVGYGNCIALDHGDGLISLYAHCSELYVTEGQAVKQGEIVAAAGNSGYSTGAHLHFEMRKDGTPIDPTPYLNGEVEIEEYHLIAENGE
ncbi:MAG: M23 family metallopeptidase [Bacteroides sp.]|nr:M23 family metallopeptidase [Eubacterium sp.]MCM1418447.1 M23 family metallopeptidase [Roseburia sp.]MCM1462043.1 M23 family metallopeptidase [Bacteroides sp.]